MKNGRTQIWSSGGGTQSAAIAALICLGEIEKPDLSIIVDTEREKSTTWAYLDAYVIPSLAKVGVQLERVKKSEFAKVDLYRKDEILIPAFTTESGEVGKLPTYCSNEWKRRVVQRWANRHGVKAADLWIGYSIDEMKRVTQRIGKWQNRYVLIERRMTRADCISLVTGRMGWPVPPRSSCWMCPNQSESEWEDQKKNNPADHVKAINFQREIQKSDENLWLTKHAADLETADFSSATSDMFTGRCDSGMCFV
jgi:hypothetical protein